MSRQLAALRGLAAMVVVLNHSLHMGIVIPEEMGYTISAWGRAMMVILRQLGIFAVPIFLFISGCYAVYAAQSNPQRISWRPSWAGLRFLLVPYVLWSLAFYLLLYLSEGKEYSVWQYLKYLAVGYPFNFVPLYLLFTLLAPLIVWATRRRGWQIVAAIALGQVLLMNIINPNTLHVRFPAWTQALVPPAVGVSLAVWAIYFPLGVWFSLNSARVIPVLRRLRLPLLAGALLCFALETLRAYGIVRFPLAEPLAACALVLAASTLQRKEIPFIRQLELVGKRAYPLYLTNIIIADILLLGIRVGAPWLFNYQFLLQPLVFIVAAGLPLAAMHVLERLPVRGVYRYVFG